MRLAVAAGAALAAAACASLPGAEPAPQVRLDTAAGPIVLELDAARAPVTTCNFLRYVRDGAYDGGSFYRTVRRDRAGGNPNPIDVIQAGARGGEEFDAYGPIPLERTSVTGRTHLAGEISMARDGPDTATSSFFIVVRDSTSLDFGGARNPDGQGFAAFGRVISGLEAARAIQQAPAGENERLNPPVAIRSARLIRGGADVCAAPRG